MADITSSWNVPQSSIKIDPNEKLFLFGYSCKIFPHDEKADYVEKGKHLIPWMGDKTLMIDRYDVRGYLHDLKQYEPTGNEDFSSEEEMLIDEERYRSLRSDMTEEQLYQEEELKRLRAAIAGDGAYHEIGFTYDNPEIEEEDPIESKLDDPEDDLYQVPEGLNVPKEMEVPYNMKIHAIIEKTANFVSEQGGQMEIIIKMKQHANPQFAFMHLDNPLHPYYRHLVKEIKSGAYKPVQTRRGCFGSSLLQRVSRSEDEDDDGHYLHPSLMAGKSKDVPEFTVPTINFRRSQDDSYSLLVKNLQQHLTDDKNSAKNEMSESNIDPDYNGSGMPPPDIQPVVDKMAEYVAKNGEDFEIIVKSKKDSRFDFLYAGKEYHDYYVYKRDCAKIRLFGPPKEIKEEIPFISTKVEEPVEETVNSIPLYNINNIESQDSSDSLDFLNSPSDTKAPKVIKGPISFSLKVRDSEASPDVSKPTQLLLGDDSDDDEDGNKTPREVSKPTPEIQPTKTSDKIMTEALEAKLAEERIKDKLLATARERLAQQRKEKQQQMEQQKRAEQQKKEKLQMLDQQRKEKELQLERKRKAALFLKMLKRRNPDSAAPQSTDPQDFWSLPDTSNAASPENGILFPIDKIIISTQGTGSSNISGMKSWSPDSGESATEEPSKTSDKESCDSDSSRKERRKKRRRRSRSKERSSRRPRDRHKKSPPRHYKPSKKEKEKQLPAAYAIVNRSRSRSRSPRRYRSLVNWKRR